MTTLKLTLKILAIIIFIVVVVTGNELLTPLRDSTISVSEIIQIEKGAKINFRTHYDYGYTIELKVENSPVTRLSRLKYELTIDGDSKSIDDHFGLGNAVVQIGEFKAHEGDKCSFEILEVDKSLIGKNGLLRIDVNGGGPSIGNYWAKELRPTIKMIFSISLLSFIILLLIIYRKWIMQITRPQAPPPSRHSEK